MNEIILTALFYFSLVFGGAVIGYLICIFTSSTGRAELEDELMELEMQLKIEKLNYDLLLKSVQTDNKELINAIKNGEVRYE